MHYKCYRKIKLAFFLLGAPQVLTDTARTKKRVVVEKDEDAVITVYFCSDPSPRRSYWEWGSLKLESGEVHIRYTAEPLHHVSIILLFHI